MPPVTGINPETGEAVECPPGDPHLSALIFKIAMLEGRKLAFVRIYSGKLKAGNDVFNPSTKKKEKLSRLLRMHANKKERVDEAGAGSILGVIGLKESSTGESLCSIEHPVLLEQIEFYKPVISVAIEPKTHSDQEKLEEVLNKYLSEYSREKGCIDEKYAQNNAKE